MALSFSQKLTKYREKADLNKTELAKKLGVSLQMVINYESVTKEYVTPSLEMLQLIIMVLKVPKDEQVDFIKMAIEANLSTKQRALRDYLDEINQDVELDLPCDNIAKLEDLKPLFDDKRAFQFMKTYMGWGTEKRDMVDMSIKLLDKYDCKSEISALVTLLMK